MGAFTIPIGLGHPDSGDLREVEAVVDTGAIDSMVPASLLAAASCPAPMVLQLRFGRTEAKAGNTDVASLGLPLRTSKSPAPGPFRQRRLQVPARGYGPRDLRPHGRPRRATPRPSPAQSSPAYLRPPPQDSVASPPSSAHNHPSPSPPTFTPCQFIRTNVPYRRAPQPAHIAPSPAPHRCSPPQKERK